jgi:hypothetical protein
MGIRMEASRVMVTGIRQCTHTRHRRTATRTAASHVMVIRTQTWPMSSTSMLVDLISSFRQHARCITCCCNFDWYPYRTLMVLQQYRLVILFGFLVFIVGLIYLL